MSATGWLVVSGCVLVVLYCALILLVEQFSIWAVNRANTSAPLREPK